MQKVTCFCCMYDIKWNLFVEFNKRSADFTKKVSLLASVRIHFREVEADALIQTVVLMGGGAAL